MKCMVIMRKETAVLSGVVLAAASGVVQAGGKTQVDPFAPAMDFMVVLDDGSLAKPDVTDVVPAKKGANAQQVPAGLATKEQPISPRLAKEQAPPGEPPANAAGGTRSNARLLPPSDLGGVPSQGTEAQGIDQ